MSKDWFSDLVQTHKDMVYNTCLGILHHLEDAEDAAQEVFIEIHQHLHRFKGEAKIETWMYRIAVNKSLEVLRKRKALKREGKTLSVDKMKYEMTSFEHPGVSLENKERAKILMAMIYELPEDQITAFTLHKIEGLKHIEIAEIMNKTVSSVESLIHRAKVGLRKKLKGYHEKI
jgi:RNA polymerase sigma-70 factor (ECF subfamily)